MLLYVKQNIFESPAQVLVNAVNTVGVMGKGIAKKYKQLYPDMYTQYRHFCEEGLLDIGKLWLYKDENKWILNFPTKKHWRNPSKIEYIESGLQKFVETYQAKGIHSISFPQLGTGNGGLDWEEEVKPLFDKYLKGLPIDVFVHIVDQTSTFEEHKNITETRRWLQKQPTVLSVDFVWEDIYQTIIQKDLKWNNWEFEMDKNPVNPEKEKVKIIGLDNDIDFYREDLFDIWITLRNYGYLFAQNLPEKYRINDRGRKILKLLTLLPYIQPIEALTHRNQLTTGVTIRKIDLPNDKNQGQTQSQMELLFG